MTILATLFVTTPALGSDVSREAERQAGFARGELAAGQCARALRSAESALRLEPEFAAAYLLKSKAYECAGDYAQAIATVRAVLDLADGVTRTQAEAELERLESAAAIAGGTVFAPEDGLRLEGAADPFAERVETALADGKCSLAIAAAEELRRMEPGSTTGWMLLGDGLRCAGRNRDAVLAYTEYAALGGDDADKLALLGTLRAGLGQLAITWDAALTSGPTRLTLRGPEGLLAEATRRDGTASFADLPVGAPLSLRVEGRGLAPTDIDLGALESGESRSVPLELGSVGFGTVRATAFDPTLVGDVVLRSGGSEVVLRPSGAQVVTAGEVLATIGASPDASQVPLAVEPDSEVPFDPTPYRPSALTVSSLPAGSWLRVSVVGEGGVVVVKQAQLPPHAGSIEAASGLRLAAPITLRGLVGGEAGIAVLHPTLGEWVGSTVVERGAANGFAFEPTALEGTDAIAAEWQAWQAAQAEARRAPTRGAVVSGVLGGLLLAGGVAGVIGGAVMTDDTIKLGVLCGVAQGRGVSGASSCSEFAAAERARTALLVGGGVGLGLGTVGFVLSGVFSDTAARVLPPQGPWDPWAAPRLESAP